MGERSERTGETMGWASTSKPCLVKGEKEGEKMGRERAGEVPEK